jgi:outer membrane receptor protein involved in Fe transport
MALRCLIGALVVLLSVPLARAQTPASAPAAQQKPEPPKPDQPEPVTGPEESPVYKEQVVVTASKTEQALVNAPATVSLITGPTLQNNASTSYADLFRAVPGLNVTQTSARDINLTSRGSTSTLSTSQLALVDGRSIYLDFFGFIAWDFLPVNPAEIKQIEIIRGPASAIWGANALNGVVNVITKSPREFQGSHVTMGVGTFGRDVTPRQPTSALAPNLDRGLLFYVNGSHAQAVNDRWAYKVSAGVYSQDPLARPVGAINPIGTQYPAFTNQGTTQPKLDARTDYDFEDGKSKLIFQGGVAGTDGILHSGIGPFDINSGTVLGYGKVNYSKGALKANFFTNILNGDATNLLAVGVNGKPLDFSFKSKTFDFEVGDVRTFQQRQVVSYGGNFRFSTFDLSIAPAADTRKEGGAYVQDEIFFGKYFRWLVGVRVDKFDIIENAQVSPRTTFMIKPSAEQTIRLSYNRAYRAPSVINNYLDTRIINQLPLDAFARFNPALAGKVFNFPLNAVGSNVGFGDAVPPQDLVEQSITAYEVGYTGIVKQRATVSAAFYFNETKDDIFFTQVASYRAASPPPGWTAATGLPTILIDLALYCPPGTTPSAVRPCPFGVGNGLPAAYSYRNLGKVRQKGLELGLDGAFTKEWSGYVNYSYQPEPEAIGFPQSELNLPPADRFNIGVNYGGHRFLGNLAVSYQSEAFWQDVLDNRYAGLTDSYTLLNGTFGVKWGEKGNTVTLIKATNLLNDEIQQHIFGDVSRLQVVAELRVGF